MSLFQKISFISHSGKLLRFKIECDALTDDDWVCLADIIGTNIVFSEVEGVPRGGLKLAERLKPHRKPRGGLLIVDDVLTTGNSMEEYRAGREAKGAVVFNRCLEPFPDWIWPIFNLNGC